MKKPKIQHYVPQFYLRAFALKNSEQLFVLDKVNINIYPESISKLCGQNYYYSYKENDCDAYNFIIEEYLSKKETQFSKVLSMIISGIDGYYYNSKDMKRINHKEKIILFEFIYFQLMRVPKYLDKLFNQGVAFIKELNIKYNHFQSEKEIKNDIKKIWFPKLFDNVQEFIAIMNKRNLVFMIIDKNLDEYFISSDNPVIMLNSEISVERVGIVHPMTEIAIPISKNILLSIRETYIESRFEYNLITSKDNIKRINRLIKDNSVRFVYSCLERLLI